MKKSFWFFLVLTIGIMIMIFAFSAQNAEASSEMSMGFIRRFINEKLLQVMSHQSAEVIQKGIETIVRKSAHFFIYMCLGFSSCMTLHHSEKVNKKWILFIITVCFCIFYATTDEVHQLFSEGRSCELRDVAIDSAGSMLGAGISIFIQQIINKHVVYMKTQG